MIYFSIPGFYEACELNFKFLDLYYNHSEYFYDNIKIEAVYGNPQFCIWDGGRVFTDYNFCSSNKLQKIIKVYNENFNIPIRYVFTNPMIEKEDYYNRYCNLMMILGSNYNNEIVTNNDDLAFYLKEKYPSYSFISSTTKCLTDFNDFKKELHKNIYDRVCIDYNLNKKFDLLKTLTEEEKEKTEFLINAICKPGCPYRKQHYKLNGISHLHCGKNYALDGCFIDELIFHPNLEKFHIDYNMIVEKYEKFGFSHFKIEGRTWGTSSLCLTYVKYMVKPEFQNLVINMILE